MGMVSRNIERYELVPLIITEHERALAVQEVLYEVWRLGRSFNEQRNREFFELLASEANESPANWAAAASARRVNQRELILWQEYRMLMLRLRTLLTCDEYRRLLGSNGFEMRKEASCSGQL